MEEIKLIIDNEASLFLDELIEVLYKNEYFGFIESAEAYVSRIYEFIFDNIRDFPSKKSPHQLLKFGKSYIVYKINPRTTWYNFFEKQNSYYFITHIINNHCEDAKWLQVVRFRL